MRRAAGVRRDVAVAGRRASRRGSAADGAGAARRAATQVPRMLVLDPPCVACSVRDRAARSQRSARPQSAPAPARAALAPRAPPARRHPPAPRRAIRRLRSVSTHPPNLTPRTPPTRQTAGFHQLVYNWQKCLYIIY